MTRTASPYNISYKAADGSTYNLTDIRVGYWYNDLTQSEAYVDQYTVHVTSGILTMSMYMNYSIKLADGAYLTGQASDKFQTNSFFF